VLFFARSEPERIPLSIFKPKFFVMRLLLLLFCTFCSVASGFAQLSSTDKRALKLYNDANAAIRERDFAKGISLLEKSLKEDPNFFEAAMSLAVNYNLLGNRVEAENYYRKAAAIKPNSASAQEAYFMVAEYDFAAGKYAESKVNYEKYLSFSPKNMKAIALAKKRISSADYAVEMMKNPLSFTPKPLNQNINTEKMQYFPVITADNEMMIFVRRKSFERKDDENLFTAFKKNGDWDVPLPMEDINTPGNEGTCTMSADGKILIFSSCEGNPDRKVIGSCDLFISYRTGDKWSKPQNMGPVINSPEWDSQPSLSADGRELYFVSNRRGGPGANDIWVARRDAKGEWQKPVPLPPPINTPGDEIAPFIHASGKTLYFASDTHQGLGGYDLFKSDLQKDKTWGKPQNMGYPINTHLNQVGLFVTSDGKKGFYSVEENKGPYIVSSIIHEFDIPEQVKSEVITSYVKGVVYDAKTKEKLNALIELTDVENKTLEAVVESDPVSGQYLFVINAGSEYALNVTKSGYLFQSLAFDYKNKKAGEPVILDIYLEKIEKGNAVTLNNIFFETGKWDLLEKSSAELENVLIFLKNNPSLKIEISGHTDDVGSTADNLKLSENRAKSVRDYLTEKGIAPDRIVSKGYGETKPKVPNNSDANRAVNRRIEFKIL
jgi:outer membrane protein OmpA-like peptidoglycan-associated protein/tetratricopeptide (TPR) repeat protein